MADRHSSIVTNDNLLAIYLQKRALATLHENVWYYECVAPENRYPLPMGEGVQMTFNAWRRIPAASSTLAEASGNAAIQLSSRKVNVSVASYGRCVKLTDLFEKTSSIAPNEGALMELEQSMALSMDNALQLAIFQNEITRVGKDGTNTKTKTLSAFASAAASAFCANTGTVSTTSYQFGFPVVFAFSSTKLSAVGATAPSTSAVLGPHGIRKAVKRLRNFSVRPFANGKLRGVMHTYAWADLQGNVDYHKWIVNYVEGPRETMMKGAVTDIMGVELLESPNAPQYRAAHSCHLTFICGRDALGAVTLGEPETIITRPGPQSTNDPFHLNSYVSYKFRMVGAVLNPSAGVILLTHEKP